MHNFQNHLHYNTLHGKVIVPNKSYYVMTEEILILSLQPLSSEIFVISIGRNNSITAGFII